MSSDLVELSSAGTVTRERSPHALHRSINDVPLSDRPTISVRWLPHFGHIGGGVCAAASDVW